MADKWVIGKDCTYESVCNAFQNSRAYKLPLDKWVDIPNELIPTQKHIINRLADEIELGVSTFYKAYRVVLEEWQKIEKNGASLGVLVNVFDKFELDDAADEVREMFGLPPNPLNFKKYDELLKRNKTLATEHIRNNIGDLSRDTKLTDDIIKKLLEKQIITDDEVNNYLNDAVSDRAKAVRFYNILMKKPHNYNKVLALLKEDEQIEALWTMQRFYRHLCSNQKSTSCSTVLRLRIRCRVS